MGIPFRLGCGCEFDVWFRFNMNGDAIEPIMPEQDRHNCTFCVDHTDMLMAKYAKMQKAMLDEYGTIITED